MASQNDTAKHTQMFELEEPAYRSTVLSKTRVLVNIRHVAVVLFSESFAEVVTVVPQNMFQTTIECGNRLIALMNGDAS